MEMNENEINIIFINGNQREVIHCKSSLEFAALAKQYCDKSHITNDDIKNDNIKFKFGDKILKIDGWHSLNDLGLQDNSEINVVKSGKDLKIIFNKNNQKIEMQFESEISFSEAVVKYCNKLKVDPKTSNLKYKFGNKELKSYSFKSLIELGLTNNSEIIVEEPVENTDNKQNEKKQEEGRSMNIIFLFDGRPFNMQCKESDRLCDLISRYMFKSDLSNKEDKPVFVYMSKYLDINETRTLRELGYKDGANIEVILSAGVIGAYYSY